MSDPVLLITGASSGIGAATARLAAEAGYRVALAARSEQKLKQLVDELGGADRALAIRCDVKEYAEQQAMVQQVLDHFGQLDAVYANAGMPGSEGGFSGSMYSASKWAVTGMGLSVREELRGTGVRVTLIEPGMVDTPLFDKPPAYALAPEDIGRAVVYALSQPTHVDLNEMLIRPTPPAEAS